MLKTCFAGELGGYLWFNCFECIFYIYGNLLVTVLICMLINISGENVGIYSIDKFILSIKFKYFMNKNFQRIAYSRINKIGEFMQVIIILLLKVKMAFGNHNVNVITLLLSWLFRVFSFSCKYGLLVIG